MTGIAFSPPISVYTREQAIEAGVLVDARAGELADVTRQHFGPDMPVVMTAGVFQLIKRAVEHPRWHNDWNGVWHDILSISRLTMRRSMQAGDRRRFIVVITGTGRVRNHELHVAFDGEALTYMLPGED